MTEKHQMEHLTDCNFHMKITLEAEHIIIVSTRLGKRLGYFISKTLTAFSRLRILLSMSLSPVYHRILLSMLLLCLTTFWGQKKHIGKELNTE
jgi:hypothetical protein